MNLDVLWFILVAVLFIGYFFLEGFDYGVGILLPFLGKSGVERRILLETIGPFWDGNEVWLITAGGAIFAAFPHWYATLFSGFYLALALILVALVIRGVAVEFRNKLDDPGWQSLWDWLIFIGSLIPALLWGVAVANLLKGVPIAGNMQYIGSFWSLISVYTLVGGVALLLLFILHGALFLYLKTEGELMLRAWKTATSVGILAIIFVVMLAVLSYVQTDMFTKWLAVVALLLAAVALLTTYYLLVKQNGWAFLANGLTIIFAALAFFAGLFPRVMVSSLNPAWNLTVYNASSSPYTLKIMTIVAVCLVPIVLVYQGWTYWVFRHRVTEKQLQY